MLETKRINAYGRRAKRIIHVSTDREASYDSPVKKSRCGLENAISTSPPSAHKLLSRGRKVNGQSTSPRGSPKAANIFGIKKIAVDTSAATPKRKPFSLKSTTLPASPSIVYLGHRAPQPPSAKVTSFAPFIDSHIVVSGEPIRGLKKAPKGGSNLSGLRNEVEVDDEAGHSVRPPRRRVAKRPIIISDDEDNDCDDDDEFTLRRSTRGVKANPIVISDVSSDEYPEIIDTKPTRNPPVRSLKVQSNAATEQARRPTERISHPVQTETSTHGVQPSQPKPVQTKTSILLDSARPPTACHPCSPRRRKRKPPQVNQTQPSEPLSSASDIVDSFTALVISRSKNKRGLRPMQNLPVPAAQSACKQTIPPHLIPLLAYCEQTVPHCFNNFVETFPFDELHGGRSSAKFAFRKIGEASYSEVFAIGDIVLKIIPLRNESCMTPQTDEDVDLPHESDARDVLQEVIVTRSMGQTCPGFINLLRTYVVIGEYPPLLLSLWDQYNATKSSENIRPDVFPSSQAYALLVLPNGGPDLEAYTFPTKSGWQQACSIFWQVAKALAIAENLVSFEHRDLHWGQILVKASTPARKLPSRTPSRRADLGIDGISNTASIPMDHTLHGVTATIIDLGLARMDDTNSNGNGVYWTAFEDFIFEGQGDYQFDMYRMMKSVHRDGKWDQFCPLTNVMWLHYLTTKLIRSKRLRPPERRKSTVVNGFSEKQCYDCLVEMEQLLGRCIPSLKGKKNRGVVTKPLFSRAGDVVDFARGRGWLE